MKEKKIDPQRCVTPVGVVSYPQFFKAKAYEDKEPVFSGDLIFSQKTDLIKIKKAIFAAKKKKWGADKDKWPTGMRSPIKDGNEKKDKQGYKGNVYITCSNKLRPDVVDKDMVPITEASGDLYAGCRARFAIRASAYDNKGNKGVSLYLEFVQKIGEGNRMSGRPPIEEVFDSVEDDESEETEENEDDDAGF